MTLSVIIIAATPKKGQKPKIGNAEPKGEPSTSFSLEVSHFWGLTVFRCSLTLCTSHL